MQSFLWRLDFSSSKCIFAAFTRDPRQYLVVQRLQRLINKLILFKNIIFLSPFARCSFLLSSDAMTYGCATVFSIIFLLDDGSCIFCCTSQRVLGKRTIRKAMEKSSQSSKALRLQFLIHFLVLFAASHCD